MDVPSIVLTALGLVITAATAGVIGKRSAGLNTIKLLQINVQSYKDAEKLKDSRIAYLEGQLLIKDETIKRILGETK